MRFASMLIPLLGLAAGAAPSAPPQVLARVAALDAQCRAAGGRPVAQPYIYVHDYTGDGRPDYLISEGNYSCAGKPDLLRKQGKAAIEVFATRDDGNAVSVYRASIAGYRLLDRTPTLIQIQRTGADCPGASACGFDLVWNGGGGRLEERPTGAASAAAHTVPAIAEPAMAGSPVPMTRAQYLADCADRMKRAGANARAIPSSCTAEFQRVTVTLPLARTVIKVAQTPPSSLQSLAGLKAAIPGGWQAGPKIPGAVDYQAPYGRDLTATASWGQGKPVRIGWSWMEQSQTFPYDVPGALRYLGARATAFACATGGGNYGDERDTHFRVELPGATPFELSVGGRDAASGGESGYWTVTMRPGAPVPSYAALVARASRDPEDEGKQWSPSC